MGRVNISLSMRYRRTQDNQQPVKVKAAAVIRLLSVNLAASFHKRVKFFPYLNSSISLILYLELACNYINFKPRPNGVASRRKLKTWGYLRHRLARACLHLRRLALTRDDLRSLWSRSNLHTSQSKFFTVWPPNPSQRKLIDVH